MAINIPAKLVKIDKVLTKQKLYTPATYKEVIPASNPQYDPVSGTYLTDKGTINHSFKTLPLNQIWTKSILSKVVIGMYLLSKYLL